MWRSSASSDVVTPGRPRFTTPFPLRRRRRRSFRSTGRLGVALAFLLPALAWFTLFHFIPDILNFYYAFTDWVPLFHPGSPWVGLRNFDFLWRTGVLRDTIVITGIFAVVNVVLQNIVALLFALALEQTTRTSQIYRTLLFLPVLVSPLAWGYVFKGILQPNGPLNAFLSLFVTGSIHYPWLADSTMAIYYCAAVSAWKWFGITMLIYIAGLNSIPRELEESARVEGAGAWNVFRHVKWPLLAPALTFNLALSVIGGLQAFDIILALTAGGPGTKTTVFNYYILNEFTSGYWGLATAMSLVLFLAICAISIPMIVYLRRREVTL